MYYIIDMDNTLDANKTRDFIFISGSSKRRPHREVKISGNSSILTDLMYFFPELIQDHASYHFSGARGRVGSVMSIRIFKQY